MKLGGADATGKRLDVIVLSFHVEKIGVIGGERGLANSTREIVQIVLDDAISCVGWQ